MIVLKILVVFFPWPLRRLILNLVFGYQIHAKSRIGLAWVFPRHLVMDAGSSIGHLTVCKGLDLLKIGEHAHIGRGNWITAYPSGPAKHFAHQTDRHPQLLLGAHTRITHRHIIDCTNTVSFGKFTTFAGFRSQILTHSIDIEASCQSSAPIEIGDFCFIGTDCVLLGGSSLPDNSILGAKSLLNKHCSQTFCLYAGVPASPIKELDDDLAYFSRVDGFVA